MLEWMRGTRSKVSLTDRLPAPGEGEELLGEVLGTHRRMDRFLQPVPLLMVGRYVDHGYLDVADDGSEHIIEIMCNAPGQNAQGLQFLVPDNLLLHVMTLGHIPGSNAEGLLSFMIDLAA